MRGEAAKSWFGALRDRRALVMADSSGLGGELFPRISRANISEAERSASTPSDVLVLSDVDSVVLSAPGVVASVRFRCRARIGVGGTGLLGACVSLAEFVRPFIALDGGFFSRGDKKVLEFCSFCFFAGAYFLNCKDVLEIGKVMVDLL